MTTTDPYAAAFAAYYDAGWAPIWLPYANKTPPPAGFTGRAGVRASFADCWEWSQDGPGNIGLALQDDDLGIDVDAYNGKTGAETLAALVTLLGPLPPTVRSSSRGDGISGIYLYRVPCAREWRQGFPGIEIIQKSHRYAVVWPSIHPEGRVYTWFDERTGKTLSAPPSREDIPMLPEAWIEHLLRPVSAQVKVELPPEQLRPLMDQMRGGEPCRHVEAFAAKAAAAGMSRHDAYKDAVLAVLGAGRRGCPGAPDVITMMGRAFVASIADRAKPGEAAAEYMRLVDGALALIATEPQGDECPDERDARIADYVETLPKPVQEILAPPPVDAEPVAVEHDQGDAEDLKDDTPIEVAPRDIEREAALSRESARHLLDLQARDRAREAYAEMLAGGRGRPSIVSSVDFMAQPDEDVAYRVDQLWPLGGRALLIAQAKTGKTTMVVSNLLPALLGWKPRGSDETMHGAFLDHYDVAPVTGRIVYMNVEVGEATLRRWLRRARVPGDEKLHILNLRGQASALSLSSQSGRDYWSQTLKAMEAELVILDPLAAVLAAHGLDENSNTDVAQFWTWWGEMLKSGGVTDDLVVHHAGHGGERSRGASRLLDEPDAIWTLTKSGGDDGTRYLEAMGRDVDLSRHELVFDSPTGRLTLGAAKGSGDGYGRWIGKVLDIIDGKGYISRSDAEKLGSRNDAQVSKKREYIGRALDAESLIEVDGPSGGKRLMRVVPYSSPVVPLGDAYRRPLVPPPIGGDGGMRGRRDFDGGDD